MKARIFLAAALAAASLGPAMAATAQSGTLSGEVLEARSVEGYTYLRLKTATGETWAAVPTTTVKPGERVTLADPMVMENFESKSLKRKFDRIVFATVAGNDAAPAAANAAPAAASAAPRAAPKAAPAPAPVAKVAKATEPDAKTVGEVSTGKAALKDRSVTVRGQVVKVNSGILGKNWLHLQDGTGKAADGSDDLIVTTTDAAAVGDVVTISGTVRTDVNVGSGYAYAVLVENAKVRK
ncbi:MAG TPA: nucleotide-binding protein [Usitatibacter sp.]|nr:nucleotide-binding protein [Usitatibacter sp.]